jgi:hypothetical protein
MRPGTGFPFRRLLRLVVRSRKTRLRPHHSLKLAVTSLTCGGRSIGIVRSQTKATELLLLLLLLLRLTGLQWRYSNPPPRGIRYLVATKQKRPRTATIQA